MVSGNLRKSANTPVEVSATEKLTAGGGRALSARQTTKESKRIDNDPLGNIASSGNATGTNHRRPLFLESRRPAD
jgi:hypothetical protein